MGGGTVERTEVKLHDSPSFAIQRMLALQANECWL